MSTLAYLLSDFYVDVIYSSYDPLSIQKDQKGLVAFNATQIRFALRVVATEMKLRLILVRKPD